MSWSAIGGLIGKVAGGIGGAVIGAFAGGGVGAVPAAAIGMQLGELAGSSIAGAASHENRQPPRPAPPVKRQAPPPPAAKHAIALGRAQLERTIGSQLKKAGPGASVEAVMKSLPATINGMNTQQLIDLLISSATAPKTAPVQPSVQQAPSPSADQGLGELAGVAAMALLG
jgi:hypothetical protein